MHCAIRENTLYPLQGRLKKIPSRGGGGGFKLKTLLWGCVRIFSGMTHYSKLFIGLICESTEGVLSAGGMVASFLLCIIILIDKVLIQPYILFLNCWQLKNYFVGIPTIASLKLFENKNSFEVSTLQTKLVRLNQIITQYKH